MSEHTCPINGCATSVAAAYPLCAEHERILPTDLRIAVERTYNRHQPLGGDAEVRRQAALVLGAERGRRGDRRRATVDRAGVLAHRAVASRRAFASSICA